MRIIRILRRAVTAFLRGQSAQIALQERYLRRQRPWEKAQVDGLPDCLQWTGQRLTGSFAPPVRRIEAGR